MSESPGTLIGLSNVLTRARARTAPAPEPDEARRARLRTLAARALEGRESFIHDAVIHGRRVRLFSNSHHLADFWRDHWPREADWKRVHGDPVPRDPALTVWAVVGVEGEPAACTAPRGGNEIFLFNTSYYGELRAATMEALGPRLDGVRLLHAGAVSVGGRLALLLYPAEVIHPTPVWGLMEGRDARLLAEGWVAADAAGRIHPVERRIYARASLVAAWPAYGAGLLRAKFENVPDPVEPKADGAEAAIEAALAAAPFCHLPRNLALEFFARLSASPDARVLADPALLFGARRVLSTPALPAAVFHLKAGAGGGGTPASAAPFTCPGFEVAAGGPPREVVDLIERRLAAS